MIKSIILAAAISAFALSAVVAPSPALAQEKQKTAAACRAEWQANKADNQANGIKEKDYVAQCRGTSPASTTTSATKAAPAAVPSATPSANTGATTTTHPPARTVAAPATGGQFGSEGQAKSHCPSDTVVWANLSSHIYHFAGTKNYGNTKQGAYMCEKEATAGGFRASKTEKHPS